MGYNLPINGINEGYNPLILTIDPNFQRDIQVDNSFRLFFSNNFFQGGIWSSKPFGSMVYFCYLHLPETQMTLQTWRSLRL